MENSNKILERFSFFKAPIKNKVSCDSMNLLTVAQYLLNPARNEITTRLRDGERQLKSTALDYVTFSCLCKTRSTEDVVSHSGLLCIDLDHVGVDEIDTYKSKIIESLPPALLFRSPSGDGLKLVYRIDINQASHLEYFNAFDVFFSNQIGFAIDKACKDVVRACFLCYDAAMYYNAESVRLDRSFIDTFQQEIRPRKTSQLPQANNLNDFDKLTRIKTWLDKKEMFVSGNRNHYTTQLLAACNRYGINQNSALHFALMLEQTDFTRSEIESICSAMYKNVSWFNTAQFDEKSFIIELKAAPTAPESKGAVLAPFESKQPEPATPPLPFEGMPYLIRDYILHYCEVYNCPRDYIAASVLIATALAIGDKIELETKYKNVPILWFAIVGHVSSGKTAPLASCLNVFKSKDSISFKQFQIDLANYRANEDLNEPEPQYFQYLLSDYTPEALMKVHAINNRGIMIYRDELKGWFDDFGWYAKSGEQSNMLSTYYQQSMVVNRKNGGVCGIEKPHILVAGGIQPEILPSLAKDDRADNGFLSRFCFVYPDQQNKAYYSDNVLQPLMVQWYETYIENLLQISKKQKTTLSSGAASIYSEWFNNNADSTNSEPVGYLKGVFGKLDVISLRLAIVLHGMKYACNEQTSNEITPETMRAAIDITEYFRTTAIKVYRKIFTEQKASITDKDVAKYLTMNKNKSLSEVQVALNLKNRSNVQYLLK